MMTREVVAGYCWPQSVRAGEHVGLHMSSSGGRPVRVEVARIGAQREVVLRADAVAADEHEVPTGAAATGCGWPVALTVDVDSTWRSGYYEVVMEIAARIPGGASEQVVRTVTENSRTLKFTSHQFESE